MSRKLFGTDGIRAKASEYPLDDPTIFALGRALVRELRESEQSLTVLLGRDTRESGPKIAQALASGIHAEGGRAEDGGVMPTPAVAWIANELDFGAGISISASHNPWEDNGIKIFGHNGMKFPDEFEAALETDLTELRSDAVPPAVYDVADASNLVEMYEDFLVRCVGERSLEGLRIGLDPGHGAAFRIAPDVFERAGAEVVLIHAEPNGKNINLDSGALHPEELGELVAREGLDLGAAFDGDADRAIFVDDSGRIRDGDEVLYLWGRWLADRKRLDKSTIVSTVMSNLGFERKLDSHGIRLVRAQVGDKYVLEKMIELGAVLGGEQSGHVIDLAHHTTGDGIMTALFLSRIIASTGEKFSRIETFEPVPQILINRNVLAKPPLEELEEFSRELEVVERSLAGRGRVLVRYSGTEAKVRVMLEGDDREEIEGIAARLADLIEADIERRQTR
ncbi:MAG: phosphoglucosamine mutase [Acidobacteria bacterium]|nr:phosphoglucosamine mutase [Acidobacteriota bacterium]